MAKIVLLLLLAFAGWRLLRGKPKPRRAEDADARAARHLLGVGPRADAEAIRAAHRRLMAQAHPDRGGAEERATALNAARDLLIGRMG